MFMTLDSYSIPHPSLDKNKPKMRHLINKTMLFTTFGAFVGILSYGTFHLLAKAISEKPQEVFFWLQQN